MKTPEWFDLILGAGILVVFLLFFYGFAEVLLRIIH